MQNINLQMRDLLFTDLSYILNVCLLYYFVVSSVLVWTDNVYFYENIDIVFLLLIESALETRLFIRDILV